MKLNLKIILLFLAINAFYFAPVIFSHNTFISRDIYVFYNPKHFFAAENIKQGTLPLWNPYLSSGVPFQANVQSCVFYPLSILYYLLPFQMGYKYFIVLHYFLGSLFMFFLMRAWGSRAYAAVIAGMVFAYGGYLVSILDNVCFLAASIWLPLILWCHHQALKTSSFFYCLMTSLCFAMQIFAGDASFYVLSTFLTVSLYTLLWPFMKIESEQPGAWLQPWVMLISSVGLGLLIASIQLIPMIELVMHSTRYDGLTFEMVTKWSYHPLEFLQLLMPYVFGSSVPEKRWFGQLWLDTFYAGIFPLIFTGFFLCYCRKRIRYFLITLLACSLLLSLGQYDPLFKLIYAFLPGMDMLQYPVKFLFPGAFCIAIMAGKGAECFFDRIERKEPIQIYLKILGMVIFILVSTLVLGGFLQEQLHGFFQTIYPQTAYYQGIEKESFLQIFKSLSVAIIFFALFFIFTGALYSGKLGRSFGVCVVIAVIFCDLAFVGKPADPYIAETSFSRKVSATAYLEQATPPARILSLYYAAKPRSFMHIYQVPFAGLYKTFQEVLLPNLNIYSHIPSADEYVEIVNKAYYHLFSPVHDYFKIQKPSATATRYRDNILNLLNIRYLISTFPLRDTQFKLIKDGAIKIYENMTCLPRAFFVAKVVVVENEEEVLRRLMDPGFDPKNMAYVSKQETAGLQGAALSESQRPEKAAAVEIINYQPNQINLKTKTDSGRLLIIADTYYPGWKAYVNGKEKPIMKVDHALRGIFLDKGEQAVTLIFKPATFIIGACISLITLASVLVIMVFLRKR